MEAKDRLIDRDEMLGCSLVGKYPFKDVADVIKEACIHQDEISFKAGVEEVVGSFNEVQVHSNPNTMLKAFNKILKGWHAKLKDWS